MLAASWKERRQELNRLQKTRQFQKSKDVKRAFRVEVEEMKRHTTCNKCGRRGHWARECRSKDVKKGQGKGGDKGVSSSGPSASGAAIVEELDFVASVMTTPTLLDRVRSRFVQACSKPDLAPIDSGTEVLLVSSPGMGVIDSGCGRTIFGLSTLRSFESMWKQLGWSIPPWLEEVHQFKFGNGNIETSRQSVQMPVTLANKRGVVKAAVIQGDAPLLLSRSALKALGAVLDFQRDELNVFCKSIPLKTNAAGQYVIPLVAPLL